MAIFGPDLEGQLKEEREREEELLRQVADRIQHESVIALRDQVSRSEVPVIVYFWAPWNGLCRAMGPWLENIVKQLGIRVDLIKVNTDENERICEEFDIKAIPCLLLFNRGREPVSRVLGWSRVHEQAMVKAIKQGFGL